MVHIVAALGLTNSLTTGEPSPLSSPVEYPLSASPESDPFASGHSVHTDDDSTRRSIDTQSDYDPLPRLVDIYLLASSSIGLHVIAHTGFASSLFIFPFDVW